MSAPVRPDTALIGAGRLARAFLPLLTRAGYRVTCVVARRSSAARAAVRGISGARATTRLSNAVKLGRLILIAVPDAAIPCVAAELAESGKASLRDRIVLHHAGALGPEALDPLAQAGAAVGVLHPFQCLGNNPRLASRAIAGSRARIEGDPRAVTLARRMARDFGLVPLRLHNADRRDARTVYHASAALLSNDLLALISLASKLLEPLGVSRGEALATLAAIARGTLLQVEEGGFSAALTGPVVRGDRVTLQAHLRALARRSKSTAQLHKLLSAELARLVKQERENS